MIKIQWKRWFDDRFSRHWYSFIKNRVWFGWWWAGLCSAWHRKDTYEHKCIRCRGGNWTRTRVTWSNTNRNSHWAFGAKLRGYHDSH